MVSQKKLEAVVFDMDGVILDSERALMEIWEEVAEEISLPGIREVYIRCCGTTHETTGQILRDAYGPDFPFEELDAKVYALRDQRYRSGLPVKSGIRELLEGLRELGIRIALATSTEGDRAARQLEAVGLLSYFDLVISGEMVQRSKPDPEIFLLAIDQLDVPADQTMIIEDSFNGIRAAGRTGAEAVMVPDLKQPDEEIRRLCDYVFPSLLEVLAHVRKRQSQDFHS
ncbi:MAG: HAD family phosphatase [Parasporobacterium sp.]|nr:HAD family phosphatase [Parasporobacterium sp.]MBQ9032976.1 HAD family phosphatase [Parasporobacterium sp.]